MENSSEEQGLGAPSQSQSRQNPDYSTTSSRKFSSNQILREQLPPDPQMEMSMNDDMNTTTTNSIKKDDNPDIDSYSAFEHLWVSSKYHRDELFSQLQCLIEGLTREEAINTFQLTPIQLTGILYLCKMLKVNDVVKFRSIELYERFLKLFMKKMSAFLKKSSKSELEEFYGRFESQIVLRMCTCILIASKLDSDCQLLALTTEKIAKLLSTQGYPFTVQHVARSEIRVLETLDYRCHWTMPLDLVEQLLCLIDLTLENLRRAHHLSLLFLEFCYGDLENIRNQYIERFKSSSHIASGVKTIMSFPLLCAAIVSAALFILSAETKTNLNLHKVVATASSLPEYDVGTLAILILDLLNIDEGIQATQDNNTSPGKNG